MKQLIGLSTLSTAIALGGCTESKEKNKEVFPKLDMNLSINPGQDFYDYSNGGWMKNHPLPDDKGRFGSFDMLAEENRFKVKTLIEEAAAKKGQEGSISQKIGDFYAIGMDTVSIEKHGIEPISPLLMRVDSITNMADLMRELAYLQTIQYTALFHIYAAPDSKNSKMMIASIYQSGLGLSDRDYYTAQGDREDVIRKAYITYLTTIFKLSGEENDRASQIAQTVMDFETKLAEVSNTRLENRDPKKTYNKMSYDSLKDLAPSFDWDGYFAALTIPRPTEFDISQPKYIAEMSKLVSSTSINDMKLYLKACIIRESAGALTQPFVDANFEMFGKVLSGKKAQEPRWKKMVNATNGVLGEAVGQLYVAKHFPAEAKTRMAKLIENLRVAFGERIDKLTWMSDSTKQAAHAKLATITVKVGYPNKWRDYSGLKITNDSYLANLIRSNEFDFKFLMDKAGKPVDPEEWEMTPQTVNAYYNPLANEIVFPAAILQPPFFYLDGDDAINYGAIGVVIGHEMTHGFDDQGRFYDKEGNLTDWWKTSDSEQFTSKTKVLVDLYNQFTVADTVKANGELTLGENIADLGGVYISYQAYQNTLKGAAEPQKLEGFTGNQRFFLSYSRVWAQNIRHEEILRLTREDVHSLGYWRVNGIVPNFQPWYDAFNINDSAELYIAPEKRASIW